MREAGAAKGDGGRGRQQVQVLLLAVVALSALALGAVHLPVQAALALMAAVVVGLGGGGRRPPLLVWGGLASLGLVALTALPLLPVTPGLRGLLQPGVAEPMNTALSALDAGPRPLSVAPAAARDTVGWMAILLAIGGPVALMGRTRTRRVRMLGGLLAVCAGVAVVGIAHRVLRLDEIYAVSGFPSGAVRDRFFAPFINPNHGGLLCALGVPLALGIGLRRDPAQTGALSLGALACVGGAVVSGSRGALAAIGIGVAVYLLLSGSRVVVASVLSAIGIAGGIVVMKGPGGVVAALTELVMPGAATPHALGQRPTLWIDTLDMVAAAPWVGVGPGGFSHAWHLFDRDPRFSNAGHAHQELLQALAEHGLVVGSLWVGLALFPVVVGVLHARSLRHGRRRRVTAGLVGALAAVLLACLFGFPLRIGAIALVYVVLSATVLGAAVQSARPAKPALERGVRGLELLGVGLGALLLGWGAWTAPAEEPFDELAVLDAHLVARPLWTDGWLARADLHLARRDLDACTQDLAIAVSTWPGSPWPRLAQARLARRLGDHAAARQAWREVLDLNLPDNDKARPWLQLAVEHEQEPALALLDLVPERADRLRDAGRVAEDLGDPIVAEMLYQKAFSLDSSTGLPLARHQISQGLPRAALDTLAGVPPQVVNTCRGQVLRSRALLASGDKVAAVESAQSAMRRCDAGDPAARTALARAQVATGDKSAVEALEALVAASPDDHALRRDLLLGLKRLGAIDRMAHHLGHLARAGVATEAELGALERVRDGLLPR